MLLSTLVVLCVGPMLAIPRTAATTFEMGVSPIFPGVNPLVASIAFFVLIWVLCVKEASVVDIVGKFLTPALFIGLMIVIIKGIIDPLGPIAAEPKVSNIISSGIISGYQTMDVLAALIFGVIIVKTVKEKGYTEIKAKNAVIGGAGLVAGAGLLIVYFGLAHLGAPASTMYGVDAVSYTHLDVYKRQVTPSAATDKQIKKYPEMKNERAYVLRNTDEDTYTKLDAIFGEADWTFINFVEDMAEQKGSTASQEDMTANVDDMDLSKLYEMTPMLKMMPKEQFDSAREKAVQTPESTQQQTGAIFVREFYKELGADTSYIPVSYTHLDVYKRQVLEDAPVEEIEEVLEFCLSVGLPVTLKELGVEEVTEEKIRAVAEASTVPDESIHNMPFEVTADSVYAAIMVADSLGKEYLG